MVKEELANRPDNTAFTQQRLPAWQPMLSAGIVIPGFLVIGLAFIGIGVALFVTSQSIQVLEVWLQRRTEAICLFSPLWLLTLNQQPLYLKRCGVSNKGRGVVAINNAGSWPFVTSWNTRGNSRPPLATSALIKSSRTVCAIWHSTFQPCSRLAPHTQDISRCWDLLTLCFLQQGPVFFYYGLSNYFQNYRKYSVSKDDEQLYGDLDNFNVS